jgi:glycine cleavage system H protein
VDDNSAYVGVTDYAQDQLGEIVFVDVTSEGEHIVVNEAFGSIEAVKTVSELLMPVTGVVLEVNPELEEHPELVNSDPYGAGWIIRIKMKDINDLDALMSAAEYQAHIGQ